jgi:hypothetical protein
MKKNNVIETLCCPTINCDAELFIHEEDDEIIICPNCKKKYKTFSSGGDDALDLDFVISLTEID